MQSSLHLLLSIPILLISSFFTTAAPLPSQHLTKRALAAKLKSCLTCCLGGSRPGCSPSTKSHEQNPLMESDIFRSHQAISRHDSPHSFEMQPMFRRGPGAAAAYPPLVFPPRMPPIRTSPAQNQSRSPTHPAPSSPPHIIHSDAARIHRNPLFESHSPSSSVSSLTRDLPVGGLRTPHQGSPVRTASFSSVSTTPRSGRSTPDYSADTERRRVHHRR